MGWPCRHPPFIIPLFLPYGGPHVSQIRRPHQSICARGLVFYSGRLIDMMTNAGAAAFWDTHKIEVILVALGILFLRPLIITFNHFFLEQTLASQPRYANGPRRRRQRLHGL